MFPSSGKRRGTYAQLGLLERGNPNQWISPATLRDTREWASCSQHLRTETRPVSETLCFIVFRIPDDGHGPETPIILSLIMFGSLPL
jgi:hypothetical protein